MSQIIADPTLSSDEKLTRLLSNPETKKRLESVLLTPEEKKSNICYINVKVSSIQSLKEEDIQIDKQKFNEIFSNLGEVKDMKELGNNTYELTFLNPLHVKLAKLGFKELVIKDLNLKFEVVPAKRKSSLPVVYSPKRWADESVEKTIKKKPVVFEKPSIPFKPNNNSLIPVYNYPNNSNKFTCRYDFSIDCDNNFQLAKKIIGAKGCNMKKIIKLTEDETVNNYKGPSSDVKLRLRGRGSGFKEGPNKEESNEPLHLCISTKSFKTYQVACKHVETLLNDIAEEYEAFLRRGRNVYFDEQPFKYKKTESENAAVGYN